MSVYCDSSNFQLLLYRIHETLSILTVFEKEDMINNILQIFLGNLNNFLFLLVFHFSHCYDEHGIKLTAYLFHGYLCMGGLAMNHSLDVLIQLADGLAKQFGRDCEIVIHDLSKEKIEHSIIYIKNGQVSDRQVGDGPSKVVLEAVNTDPASLKDHIGYLTRTANGRILKSSTMFIRDDDNNIHYIFSINYDITGLLNVDRAIKSLIDTEPQSNGMCVIPASVLLKTTGVFRIRPAKGLL